MQPVTSVGRRGTLQDSAQPNHNNQSKIATTVEKEDTREENVFFWQDNLINQYQESLSNHNQDKTSTLHQGTIRTDQGSIDPQ